MFHINTFFSKKPYYYFFTGVKPFSLHATVMRHQSVFSSTMNASVVHGVVQIDYIAVFISPAVLVTFGKRTYRYR